MVENSTRTYTKDNIHKEKVVQNHILDQLVQNHHYLPRNSKTDYDRKTALDKALVLQFIKQTQSAEWQKLQDYYTTSAESEFFKQLTTALTKRGTLDCLRNGLKLVPNIKFSLCYFKPASNLNPELFDLYNNNILSIIDELEYSNKNNNRIDLALFVNGIAVATLECKNQATGTTFKNAESQYRRDRAPAGEPLLTFKRGALVHFALDTDHISMTTRLMNGKTSFLPFNRGRQGGAGNPDIKDEWRIAYLYKDLPDCQAIFSKHILLDIIGRYMHLDKSDDGKEKSGDKLIFPRFQQLDAVVKLLNHAKIHGAGKNYLIQHSAGSGKSNTIGWLAHQMINLHNDADVSIFNTVIIITDRVVLDRQLQNTVAQFEQTKGVVKKIDGSSRQLKEAINSGARIIVSTLQKFSTDHIKEISKLVNRNFAVLIDEAHGSQMGKHAASLTKALASNDDIDQLEKIEEIIAAHQQLRGPKNNISYVAFTATPRNVTLERFGTKDTRGMPHPFHLYSMRQAIEEGFILDVLKNYITYKAYYKLEKTIEDDPKLKGRKAQRRVARFAMLHPTAIAQKVEVIVEHFMRHVAKELNGQAKAMVVTQSREQAIKYYFAIKDYIESKKYQNIKPLVAFSGELDIDGNKYTETAINGFAETKLPSEFDSNHYQLLIVAKKYQTGFDQPKLCAMYIDQKLESLQAVQTLSRLNRTYLGKDNTFILDFQNTVEDIQDAFRPYFEATELKETTNPNQIYELERRINALHIIDQDEVNRFAEIYYQGKLDAHGRASLEALVKNAVLRFQALSDDGKREEFRQLLKSYMRFYSFVAQIIVLGDTDLEKLFSYASWLDKLLPNRDIPADVEITEDMLRLQAFKVEKKQSKSGSLNAGDTKTINPIKDFGAKPYSDDEEKSLSEIINSFNKHHGTQFTKDDFLRFEQINSAILQDENLKDMLRNNAPDVVYAAFAKAFLQGAVKQFKRENQLENIIMSDAIARDNATRHFFNRALRQVKEEMA